jgi:uncharacterized protein YecE (DUF72 family)
MAQTAKNRQPSFWDMESGPAGPATPLPLPEGDLRLGQPVRPILVGTSGFSFEDWTGAFYPRGLASSDRLPFYCRYFPVVEVNSTYYGIPRPSTMESLAEKTPAGFEILVKANQQMTHQSAAPEAVYNDFRRALEPLSARGRFQGVLAQFPWRFKHSAEGRRHLLEMQRKLGAGPLFVEFRHDSWIEDDVFRFLNDHGIGYCSVDEPALVGLVPPLARLTGTTAYVRFHGRNQKTWWGKGEGDRYDYDYDRGELSEWLTKIRELAARAEKTYVFFNNCHAGQAARNARLMMDMLQQELG